MAIATFDRPSPRTNNLIPLAQGEVVEIDGERHRVVRPPTSRRKAIIEGVESGDHASVAASDMTELFMTGRLRFLPSIRHGEELSSKVDMVLRDWSSIPERQRRIGQTRERFVEAFFSRGKATFYDSEADALIREVARELDLGASRTPTNRTVKSWYLPWIACGRDVRALIPCWERRGNREPRYDVDAERLTERIVDLYLKNPGMTQVEAHRQLLDDVAAENEGRDPPLEAPALRFLERAIRARRREDRIAGRLGEAAADQDARLVESGLVTTRPLQVVEIDHTLSGLMLVDRETGYVLGRAWMTAAIDHFTGLILGTVITFHPPSVATMLAVIRQAILWKDEILAAHPEIAGYWPAFGVMEAVMIDNASEMHAKLVRDALRFLHVDITYPPVGKPKFRGTVERFMGRLDADLLRCMPGYTFDVRRAARKQSMTLACLTLEDFRALFLKWLVDVQMRSWNRGKRCVPVERWEEHARHIRPRMPPSVRDLDVLLAHGTTRCLRRTGIEFGRMFYRSPELDRLFRRMPNGSTEVQVRYNEDDLGSIKVLAPGETEWVTAHCQYRSYGPGTSVIQHKATLKWLQRKKVTSERQLLEARAQLRRSIEERRGRRRKVVPRHEVRLLGTPRAMADGRPGSGAGSVGDLRTLLTLDRSEIAPGDAGERRPLPLEHDPFMDEAPRTDGEPGRPPPPAGASRKPSRRVTDLDEEIARADQAAPTPPRIRHRYFDE